MLLALALLLNNTLARIPKLAGFLQGLPAREAVVLSFTVYSTLSTGIMKRCLALFECVEHPNGRRTLVSQPYVECGATEHSALLAPGVIFTLLYVGGYAVCFFQMLKFRFRKSNCPQIVVKYNS